MAGRAGGGALHWQECPRADGARQGSPSILGRPLAAARERQSSPVRRSVSWTRFPPAAVAVALLAGCSATASASLALPSPHSQITSPGVTAGTGSPGSRLLTPASPSAA